MTTALPLVTALLPLADASVVAAGAAAPELVAAVAADATVALPRLELLPLDVLGAALAAEIAAALLEG